MPELALEREPEQLQAIWQDDERERPTALQRLAAKQAVDHLAGRHLPARPPEPLDAVGRAGGVEAALTGRILGARVVDPDGHRIGGDRLRVRIELPREALEPARVPDVVVARPGEVRRGGEPLPRQVEGTPPVADEPEHFLVSHVRDAQVEAGILERKLARAICRAVVDHDDGKVTPRLGEERFERFRQVRLAVIGGQAEDDAGGTATHTGARLPPPSGWLG